MTSKYIFLDIDGTILDRNDYILPSAAEAIRAAMANGHHLFLSTGREYCFVSPVVLELGLHDGVFSAGANLRVDGKSIYRSSFSPSQYNEILSILARNNALVCLETAEGLLASESIAQYYPDYWNWLMTIHVKPFQIPPINFETVDKVIYFGTDTSYEEMAVQLKSVGHLVPVSYQNVGAAGEIQQLGITKATGIQRILDHLNASREDTIGIGDGINDLEMLDFCHTSVAMGNACQQVKDAATFVTAPLREDGLAKAFRSLGLI